MKLFLVTLSWSIALSLLVITNRTATDTFNKTASIGQEPTIAQSASLPLPTTIGTLYKISHIPIPTPSLTIVVQPSNTSLMIPTEEALPTTPTPTYKPSSNTPIFSTTPSPTTIATATSTPTPTPSAPTNGGGPPSSISPSPTTTTSGLFYTSSHWNSKYYYCANDPEWQTLSKTYLKTFSTSTELLQTYPSRILHKPCV